MQIRSFLLFALCIVCSFTAFSLPRFAALMNLPCQSCHVNPSGGGMRNAYGLGFGRDEITVKSWQPEDSLEEFTTKVNDFLSYGMDFRFLAFYQSKTNPSASLSSFFPMQMDMYFNLAISKKIGIYVNPAFGPYNRLEVFALAKVLPANGYLELGRFSPPYGLRLDDHTSFVRQATPFRNYAGQQTGIQIGLNPGPISVMGAVTNGLRGDLDANMSKAVYGKLEGHVGLGPLNILAGMSSYNDAAAGENINLLGGYGAVSLLRCLTVVGDVERIQGNSSSMSISSDINQRNALGTDLKQLAVMTEVDYAVTNGFELKFMYDFFDPNTDVKSGTAVRYSGGFEFRPIGGVEIRPLYRYTKDSILGRNISEIDFLVHLYL